MKEKLKAILNSKKVENFLWALMAFLMVGGFGESTLAADPKFVTGAKTLLSDVLKWVLILVPVAAAAMIGYHALMKTLSDGDPAVIAEKNKKMKNVLIGAIIAMSASGLVTAILAYF